jgi:DNA transformation protein
MPRPLSPLVEHLLDLLSSFGEVSARRTFGGYGIYRDSLMFGLVADDILYLEADESNTAISEEAGLEPFRFEMKDGRVAAMSYRQTPDEAMNSPMAMERWARLGWEAAKRSEAAKRTPRRR